MIIKHIQTIKSVPETVPEILWCAPSLPTQPSIDTLWLTNLTKTKVSVSKQIIKTAPVPIFHSSGNLPLPSKGHCQEDHQPQDHKDDWSDDQYQSVDVWSRQSRIHVKWVKCPECGCKPTDVAKHKQEDHRWAQGEASRLK